MLRFFVVKYSNGKYNKSFGKMWVHDKHSKKIEFINREDFDGNIWEKGLPFQRGGTAGKIFVNNGTTESMIRANSPLPDGWCIGRLMRPTPGHMKFMASKRHTAEKDLEHSKKMIGRKYVSKSGVQKRIQTDLVDSYLHDGWELAKNPKIRNAYKIIYNGHEYIYNSIANFCRDHPVVYGTLRGVISNNKLPFNGVTSVIKFKREIIS